MNVRRWLTMMAVAIFLFGCSQAKPAPSTPVPQIPNAIGAYREAMGPGLVLQGYTSLDRVRVEVRVGGTAIRSEEVTSKDGGPGYWTVTWPAPEARNAEVVLINPADGKELVKGAISPDLFVGLFHSSTFSDTHVDARAADRNTLRVAGKVVSGETVRVEFRDATEKVYRTEDVKVSQGTFDATLTWPAGSNIIYLYSFNGKNSTPSLGLIVHVVAR